MMCRRRSAIQGHSKDLAERRAKAPAFHRLYAVAHAHVEQPIFNLTAANLV